MATSTTTADILIRARDEASGKLGRIGRSAQSMTSMLKTAAMGAAGYLSARAILGFAKSSVDAYLESERAANRLVSALDLLGRAHEATEMQAYAAQIQRVTTMEDDAVVATMALGTSMGNMSGDTLKKATVAAIGLSKAYGMDVNTAMTLVSKAAQGNTAAMSRYGITFKEGMSDTEKFNQVLETGAGKFAMAEAETQTFSGRVTQLANAWGDAKEKLGEYIIASPKLSAAMTFAQTVMENFGLSMEIVWTKTALGMVQVWESIKYGFGTVAAAYLQYFMDNWKIMLTNIWEMAKTVVSNMWENFKNFFTSLWSWMNGGSFDFKWTGLLTGFESTLEAMKPIAARQAGEVEKILQDELAAKQAQFQTALAAKQAGGSLDTSGLGAAQLSAVESGKESKTKAGVAAVEARFLSGSGTGGPDYQQMTANNTKHQIALLQRLVTATEDRKQKAYSMATNELRLAALK